MSITDELRKWAARGMAGWKILREEHDELTAIADRIDAEHEEALLNVHTDLMDASGWIRLPKDADGEYIRVGDVMEWIDIEGEVTLTCEVDAVGVECFFAWDKANGRYAQKSASAYRHYHAPTVEDVLREFALKAAGRECMTLCSDLVDEYASKLQLREDA